MAGYIILTYVTLCLVLDILLNMERLCGISILVILGSFPSCDGQPVRSIDSPLTVPAILENTENTIRSLSEDISNHIDTMGEKITAQLAKSLKPLENLKDLSNLRTMSEKLGDPEELRETVNTGLRRISDSLSSRANSLALGLEKISEKIESINSFGLNNLASEVNKLKHYLGPTDLTGLGGLLPSISSELRGIMEKISDHGDKISNHLMTNKEAVNAREIYEQQNNERIIHAVNQVATSLDSGHQDLAESVAAGNKGVADAIDTGREHLLETLRARLPGKVPFLNNDSLAASLADLVAKSVSQNTG